MKRKGQDIVRLLATVGKYILLILIARFIVMVMVFSQRDQATTGQPWNGKKFQFLMH